MGDLEHLINAAVQWLRLMVEAIGAVIVAVGAFSAAAKCALAVVARGDLGFTRILGIRVPTCRRHPLHGHRPVLEEIGKPGAIAVIRTVLNYFLMKGTQVERSELRQEAE